MAFDTLFGRSSVPGTGPSGARGGQQHPRQQNLGGFFASTQSSAPSQQEQQQQQYQHQPVEGLPIRAGKPVSALRRSDFIALIAELRKPLPTVASGERDTAIQRDIQCLRILISALKQATDAEQLSIDEGLDWDESHVTQPGPPQAEVFKLCLLLLSQGDDGHLPLPLRLGACELLAISVQLSDMRAAKATKAVRETRSGAPGSQSNKAADADQPLANIDRATLYYLVRNLSSQSEGEAPTLENHFETRLPALPMQLRALEVLTMQGRDVVSFPGILEFLSEALETVWQELQMLRVITGSAASEICSDDAPNHRDAQQEDQIGIMEQLSLREWSVLSSLNLITSIIKLSFAKVDLHDIEYVLECLAHIIHYAPPQQATESNHEKGGAVVRRRRAKSKEKRPLTDGYDYYGLDTVGSDASTPSMTPRASQTPRIGPRVVNDSAAIAPIALATVAPSALPNASERSLTVHPTLHETEVAAVCKLIDSILRFGFMPPASVDDVCRLICCILGYASLTHSTQEGLYRTHNNEQDNETSSDDIAWSKHVTPLLGNLLRSHCANGALRSVRGILIERTADEDSVLLCGATDFLKCAWRLARESEHHQMGSASRPAEDALKPTLSIPLLIPALVGALRRHIDVLDIHVLDLVADMLPMSGAQPTPSDSLSFEDLEMLLSLPSSAKRHLQEWQIQYGNSPLSVPENHSIPPVISAMMKLLSRIRLSSPTTSDNAQQDDGCLPWTPKLAALFLSLAPLLPDEKGRMLVEYYKVGHLCLPCTPTWISNIRLLLEGFFNHGGIPAAVASIARDGKAGTTARQFVAQLLFDDVCGTVQDLPVYRSMLLKEVILPLAQSALLTETDPFVESALRRVLVDAAVTSASHVPTESSSTKDEDDEGMSSSDNQVFHHIVELHCKLARVSPHASPKDVPKDRSTGGHPHISFADPPGSHEHKPSRGSHSRSSSLGHVVPPQSHNEALQIDRSKAVQSTLDLINIFNRLAFSSPWVLINTSSNKRLSEEAQRAAWEKQARNACLFIFRRFLVILRPSDDPTVPNAAENAAPLQVRLTVLQWLVRLRTDGQHRVYIAGEMNELVTPAAIAIGRGPTEVLGPDVTEPAAISTESIDRSRPRRDTAVGGAIRDTGRENVRNRSAAERSASRVRDVSRERGRREQSADSRAANGDPERFRSQSRSRAGPNTTSKKVYHGEPQWQVPETILFDVPPLGWRSDVVYTYMHADSDDGSGCQHEHHHAHSAALRTGEETPAPLPISEYLATCIAVLSRGQEWDLVSYILCHMPHQLANKHLVCGPRAQKEVVALRQVLVTSILEQRFVNQVILPEDVKKSDVYAVAYTTLATLVSYRALYSRSQQDEIVEAFMTGLNKSSNTAQPCIRALSIACYELQKSINRHLPQMLVKLSTVMSSSAMSVHILELIATIGNLPSLYANFTETEYRRIFAIALQYIQYHHQRHSEEDTRSSVAVFTLSQYVIMLAYYNLSLWFMIIKIGDRPKYVEAIRKGLLNANEGRNKVAEQSEVCFDFLARFTYSNADARPQKSFLNHVVKAKGLSVVPGGAAAKDAGLVSKQYLHGSALVTITALDKPGWAEILVRRPSGTVGWLCKLENVVVPQLPEFDADKIDGPAAFMMDRESQQPLPPGQRARNNLAYGDERRRLRPRGPVGSGIVPRARAKSFSAGDIGHLPVKIARKCDLDAYSHAENADEEGQVLEPESYELTQTMRKVLSDETRISNGAGNSSDAPSKQRTAMQVKQDAVFDPGFVALQLSAYPDTPAGKHPTVVLPEEKWVERTMRAIDLTPVVDFHKIGVLYVGADQSEEREILGNRTGSRRYAHFLTGLGDLVTLRGQQDVYTGGLDIKNDEHGKYAYVWGDDISQIVYHTTTLMPNDEEHDPTHARKKALIGNDWVRIVWNESGREYDFDTIKTQFNFINIVISPNSRGGVELGSISSSDSLFYRVSLQRIEGLPNFSPVGDGQLVSAAALPSFVRMLALNCSLVSQIYHSSTSSREAGQASFVYTSNWVSRLQHLERARARVESEDASQERGAAATAEQQAPSNDALISAATTTSYDILRF